VSGLFRLIVTRGRSVERERCASEPMVRERFWYQLARGEH
jgi:hypothetical protein